MCRSQQYVDTDTVQHATSMSAAVETPWKGAQSPSFTRGTSVPSLPCHHYVVRCRCPIDHDTRHVDVPITMTVTYCYHVTHLCRSMVAPQFRLCHSKMTPQFSQPQQAFIFPMHCSYHCLVAGRLAPLCGCNSALSHSTVTLLALSWIARFPCLELPKWHHFRACLPSMQHPGSWPPSVTMPVGGFS